MFPHTKWCKPKKLRSFEEVSDEAPYCMMPYCFGGMFRDLPSGDCQVLFALSRAANAPGAHMSEQLRAFAGATFFPRLQLHGGGRGQIL